MKTMLESGKKSDLQKDRRYPAMNNLRVIAVMMFICSLVFGTGKPSHADPKKHDIGAAGPATITGSLGGSVTGNPSLLSDLVVTVNFGELTPINTNGTVKVVVPVAIRSTTEYQVTMSITGTVGTDPDSVQLSDIGIGIQNFRSLGARATACSANSVINNLFNNDPATAVTINPVTGRAQYQSSLANIGASTLFINGPVLSIFQGVGNWRREVDNGRAFDVILAVKPQWFEPGAFSLTLIFRMDTGPNFPC